MATRPEMEKKPLLDFSKLSVRRQPEGAVINAPKTAAPTPAPTRAAAAAALQKLSVPQRAREELSTARSSLNRTQIAEIENEDPVAEPRGTSQAVRQAVPQTVLDRLVSYIAYLMRKLDRALFKREQPRSQNATMQRLIMLRERLLRRRKVSGKEAAQTADELRRINGSLQKKRAVSGEDPLDEDEELEELLRR